MNILEWYRNRQRSKLLAEINKDLHFIRQSENQGLKFRRLSRMKDVKRVSMDEGFTSFVEVEMNDGYLIDATDRFSDDMLRSAALEVAKRLKAVYK